MRAAPADHGLDRWVFRGMLAVLVLLPLPWGSKPEPAAAALGAMIGVLVLIRVTLAYRGSPLPPVPLAARWAMRLWFVWLAWAALHLIPLPPGLLQAWSPAAHAAHAAVEATGAPALWTLSAAPGSSVDQLILSMNYVALFWLVLSVTARNRERQRWTLYALLASGVAQALYGSVMTLSGWEYGFLEPKSYGLGRATGTFVNQNHLAGYLELALAAGISLVLADLRPSARVSWREFLAGIIDLALSRRLQIRVMLAIMVVALVLTRSRGGNLAFFLSLALCGSLFMLVRHPRYFGKSLVFFLSLFAVDLLIISESYGLDKLVQRFEATDLEGEQRGLALRDVQPLLSQYGTVGAGLGAFHAVFAAHRSLDLRGDYDHVHNDHLEFLIEAGMVGYAVLAAIALITMAHALAVVRRRRDPMAAALAFSGAMALASLLVHGLLDFNLRIPAVAATLVALMALSLGCSATSRRRADSGAPPPVQEDTTPRVR